MVKCMCGKPMEKVPDWLADAKVDFVCNNCPNRQTKNIAFVSLEVVAPVVSDDVEEVDLDEADAEEIEV